MAVNFPLALQQKLNEAGFSFNIGSTSIRSNVDIGAAKIRRRYTKAIDTQSCSIDLIYSDYQVFYDFYNTTLAGGSLTFLYDNPFTGVEEEYRFLQTPTISPKGGEWFNVSMSWEKMP